MRSLEDNVAIVTGAAGGIGTAIALALAEEGARVVVCDLASRRDDGLAPLADAISHRGGEAIAMAVDVSRKAAIEAAVAATLGAWGGVDILVNNAGTTAGAGPFLDITDTDWQSSFDVNLKAPADFAQAVIPEMQRRGGGSILNIASTAGLGASASFGAYTATAFLTYVHDCRLQIASPRPRTVCSRTNIESDNDHTGTPTTMSIDGLFFLSVKGSRGGRRPLCR